WVGRGLKCRGVPAVRVRTQRRRRARCPAAALRRFAHPLGPAERCGLRAGVAAGSDEDGHGQRGWSHQDLHPVGQHGPPGGNHPGTHRDRRWGGCPRGIGSRRLTGESREKETMTATATETSPAQGTALGRISRVIGPVVDIEFPLDSVPEIYNALTPTVDLSEGTRKLTFEVGLHL